ncbi:MAG TPA: hypothetical protein VGZ29_05710 [Terriglobia bacterium]|nr:hypothetical protein [Terriglobia bacterium]
MKTLRKVLLLLASVFCLLTPAFGQTITFYSQITSYPYPVISSENLGSPAVGVASPALVVYIQNTGTATASTVVVANSGNNTGDFALTTTPTTNCGGSLAAGATCSISIVFTPAASGSRTTSLQVSGSNFTTASITLNGIGVALNANVPNTVAPVIAAAATLSLTYANCNSLVQMGATTGEVVTLPAPIVGCTYNFVVTVSNTSNYNEIRTDGSSHFLLGSVEHSATGIAPLNFWADGSTIQAIKMDGAHLGGLIGSSFTVTGLSSTQWEISGTNECTATCTTAFTATP